MKKPLIIMLILLLLIIGGGVAAFFILKEPAPEDPNDIEIVLEKSFETEQITTSLQDNSIVQVSFKIQTDSSETKEELEKRMFQVKDVIINYFSAKTSDELKDDDMEESIKEQINKLMTNGEIERIYTTSYVLQ